MKTLIIGSGDFAAPSDINDRFIIACDGGLEHCAKNGIRPDKILGDFDSVTQTSLDLYNDIPKTKFPVKKDMTDIELGLELAFELGTDDLVITGALSGTRLDHTLCNIQLLLKCLKRGINAVLINKTNEIRLLGGDNKLHIKNEGKYVSLLPVTMEVVGITLKGFEYPLENYTLEKGSSLCVSNIIIGDSGEIVLKNGICAVICAKD